MITGRHVVLGLALDADTGSRLVEDGIIGSLLNRWKPGLGTADEPHRVTWDVLSDEGLRLAEQQPLLAAAYGAPANHDVTLPEPVRAIAWSPSGDRLAILAGGIVYEARLGTDTLNQVGEFSETVGSSYAVESIGWDRSGGVIGLSNNDGQATLRRASNGATIGSWDGVAMNGVLSGDGLHAWIETLDGVYRWSPADATPDAMTSQMTFPATTASPSTSVATTTSPAEKVSMIPVATDWAGNYALLRGGGYDVLAVAAASVASSPSTGPGPYWPAGAAPMTGWMSSRSSPCALVAHGRVAVAYAESGGVEVWYPAQPGAAQPAEQGIPQQDAILICRIASGLAAASTLAVGSNGTSLAAGIGSQVRIWYLGNRATATNVPAYVTDRPDQSGDLLDAGRDAQAIAALVSARDVDPPLSIGLFGAWGSGKSFILREVIALLAATERPEGYLRSIKVVEFNAWQYAETNLWASLVDQVLQTIAPFRHPESPPEVREAESRAEQAEKAVKKAAADVASAQEELYIAEGKLARQRRRAAWLGAAVLLIAAAAILATLFGAVGKVVAAAGAALALISAATGLLVRAAEASDQVSDLAEASRSGISAVSRLLGRPEELAVQARATELKKRQTERADACAEAKLLQSEKEHMTALASKQPLGTLLQRLATINEYRDQLSLVTRTRDHFKEVDDAITAERAGAADVTLPDAAAAPVTAGPIGGPVSSGTPDSLAPNQPDRLERVVIVIDDLDRCPPEKVVAVLEAVHLLFSFRMFVVLIAVDTRWLEQSLRIHYRRLLGGTGAPAPTDYLEKIIQVPLHLLPLDESKARAMIYGLTKTMPESYSQAAPVALEQSGQERAQNDRQEPAVPSQANPSTPNAQSLTGTVPRIPLQPLPAKVMQVTGPEAAAMSAVTPLLGTLPLGPTPRTMKRFVNTYRLLKARILEWDFDEPGEGVGGHLRVYEVVAFILAVVTGHPATAGAVLSALQVAPTGTNAEQALSLVDSPGWPAPAAFNNPAEPSQPPAQSPPPGEPTQQAALSSSLTGWVPPSQVPLQAFPSIGLPISPEMSLSLTVIRGWLATHRSYADAPAAQYAKWAGEVSRFSFMPPLI